MTKYLISRILRALFSVVLVIGVIMIMIYSFLDREAIFSADPTYQKLLLNSKEVHKMQQWEKYGYLDYIPFTDYLQDEVKAGRLTQKEANDAILACKAEDDSEHTKALMNAFTENTERKATMFSVFPALIRSAPTSIRKAANPVCTPPRIFR